MDSLSYAVDRNTIPFTVNPKTGDVCTKQVLDREQKDTYEFVVIALDGRYETKSPVVIRVLDQNDNPPKFERERYFVSIPPQSQAGRTIIQVIFESICNVLIANLIVFTSFSKSNYT